MVIYGLAVDTAFRFSADFYRQAKVGFLPLISHGRSFGCIRVSKGEVSAAGVVNKKTLPLLIGSEYYYLEYRHGTVVHTKGCKSARSSHEARLGIAVGLPHSVVLPKLGSGMNFKSTS